MTQEYKDLLIKDLCARAPYGVKYMRYSWNYDTDQELPVIETLEFVDKDGYINHRRVYKVDDIKPYLRPMSSMTGVEILEYLSLKESIVASDDITYYFETYKSIDWLNKNMFDYRGLIPMGLAIDATGKNIY